jgi:hypothetical protein
LYPDTNAFMAPSHEVGVVERIFPPDKTMGQSYNLLSNGFQKFNKNVKLKIVPYYTKSIKYEE